MFELTTVMKEAAKKGSVRLYRVNSIGSINAVWGKIIKNEDGTDQTLC